MKVGGAKDCDSLEESELGNISLSLLIFLIEVNLCAGFCLNSEQAEYSLKSDALPSLKICRDFTVTTVCSNKINIIGTLETVSQMVGPGNMPSLDRFYVKK